MSSAPSDRDPLSPEEVRPITALLETIIANRGLLAALSDVDRVRFLEAAGRVSLPELKEQKRLTKARRILQRRQLRDQDRSLRGSSEIRVARLDPVFSVPPAKALPGPTAEPGPELNHPKDCYVCKVKFHRLHFFYDSMCPECATLNYEKRFQTADLRGRTALVTGARVKIGFHCALKLLRAGARVIVTTRFPHDAATRYAREDDFEEWGDRLEVHGLDLRHAPSVELFARWVESRYERLDVLINNACQTVRRPPGFYESLLPTECAAASTLAPRAQRVLRRREDIIQALAGDGPGPPPGAEVTLASPDLAQTGIGPELSRHLVSAGVAPWRVAGPGVGIRFSALLSQIPYAFEAVESEAFPVGRIDADQQQLDLRSKNSWRLTLSEVATPELLEVHLVNAVAPFVLCSKLKPLMVRTPGVDKYIVNV